MANLPTRGSWLAGAICLLLAAGCGGFQEPPLDEGVGRLQGRVTDAAAGPLVHVQIYLLDDLSRLAHSDALGEYRLEQVPAGEHTLAAVSELGFALSTQVTVYAGQTTTADLDLTPAGRLEGRITLEGAARHDGTLVSLPGTAFATTTAVDGSFALNAVLPGCFTLRAAHAGFQPQTVEAICLAAGERRTLGALSLVASGAITCALDADCEPNQRCQAGACVYTAPYGPEVCDAQDNDGDGSVDEGVIAPCGGELGICSPGVSVCLGGEMSVCLGGVAPERELCADTLDNDCDGQTDEPGCELLALLFVVDSSGSMQLTDEADQRVSAIQALVRRYAGNPAVRTGIVKFQMRVSALTAGFARLEGDESAIFGPAGLGERDSMTDYEGALEAAGAMIADDIQRLSPAELQATRYTIVFLSDGNPEPICRACVTAPSDDPLYLVSCDQVTYPEPCCHPELRMLCTVRSTVSDAYPINLDLLGEGMLPALVPGEDYNTDARILARIDGIRALGASGPLDVSLHAAHLYCRDVYGNPTTALCAEAEENFGLDAERTEALLRAMAARGGGRYRLFSTGTDAALLPFLLP